MRSATPRTACLPALSQRAPKFTLLRQRPKSKLLLRRPKSKSRLLWQLPKSRLLLRRRARCRQALASSMATRSRASRQQPSATLRSGRSRSASWCRRCSRSRRRLTLSTACATSPRWRGSSPRPMGSCLASARRSPRPRRRRRTIQSGAWRAASSAARTVVSAPTTTAAWRSGTATCASATSGTTTRTMRPRPAC